MDWGTYRTNPSIGLGNQKLFPVLDKYLYRSEEPTEHFPSTAWTGKLIEPKLGNIEPIPSIGLGNLEPFSSIGLENIYNLYPVLDGGTYRTFSQYWTWELIEPFPSIRLGKLEPFPSIGRVNL